jgi:hypothetical protein
MGQSVLAKARKVVEGYESALIRRVPEALRPMVLPILMALWNRESD